MRKLASPNHVTWEYFFSLRQIVSNAHQAPSPELARQAAALAVIMGVTVGEVFLNVWFRVRVEEKHGPEARAEFLKALKPPFMSLDRKLKEWPKRYLDKDLDLKAGPGRAFAELKDLRNGIVHFTSSHESFTYENMSIHGLADFSEYDALNYDTARSALETAEGLVAEIFRLAGSSTPDIPHALHAWTGRIAV